MREAASVCTLRELNPLPTQEGFWELSRDDNPQSETECALGRISAASSGIHS